MELGVVLGGTVPHTCSQQNRRRRHTSVVRRPTFGNVADMLHQVRSASPEEPRRQTQQQWLNRCQQPAVHLYAAGPDILDTAPTTPKMAHSYTAYTESAGSHQSLKGMRGPLHDERGLRMPEDRSGDASQTLDPRRLLIDWANRQDSWVRRLVGHVIASQRPISGGQATEFFELFLAEKGLHGSSSEIEPELPYPQAGSAQSDSLRLRSLSKVSGVNALSPGATIDFSPGLTILYGENGTGKTGYARILKRISAVQYPEEILPNINSTAAQTPAATIDYELGGVRASVEWRNEVGVSPFTRMSVFDSPSVNVRVDESLAYVFTPAEISLFSYVSSGIRAIQERGSQALNEMAMANPFIRYFERGTVIYQEIEALGPATDLGALGILATLPEDASEERERLGREVAALGSDAASGFLAVHREAIRTLENLEVVAQGAETFEVDEYNDGIVALGTLREAYRRVREETFAPGELPGPADDAWQRFVTSAAEYLEHLGTTHYPQDGDGCIYCRQPLEPSALSIVLRYSTFLGRCTWTTDLGPTASRCIDGRHAHRPFD